MSNFKKLGILGRPVAQAQIGGLEIPLYQLGDSIYLKCVDLGRALGYRQPSNAITHLRSRHQREIAHHTIKVFHKGKTKQVLVWLISLAGSEILARKSMQREAEMVQQHLRALGNQFQALEDHTMEPRLEEHRDQPERAGMVVEPGQEPTQADAMLPVQANLEPDAMPVVHGPTAVVAFHGWEVPVYEIGGELFLTGEDLGRILGLSDPRNSVRNILERHKEEIEKYTCAIKLIAQPDTQKRLTRLYSQEGCYLVTMFARTETARDVRQWLAALPRQMRQVQELTPEMLAQVRESAIEDVAGRLLNLLNTPAGSKIGLGGMRRLTRLRASGALTQKEAGRVFEISVEAVRFIEKEMAPLLGLTIKPFNRFEENRRTNRIFAKRLAPAVTTVSPTDHERLH